VVEQPGLLEALTELIASAIRGDRQAKAGCGWCGS